MAVQSSMVNIGNAPQLPAYLAQPEGKGPFPAVVVIFEAFGLNENIKDITRPWRSGQRFLGEDGRVFWQVPAVIGC